MMRRAIWFCALFSFLLLSFGQSDGQEHYPSIVRTIERTVLDSSRATYMWTDSLVARVAVIDSAIVGIAYYDSVITIKISVTDYVASDEYRAYSKTFMVFNDSTLVEAYLAVFDPAYETTHPSAVEIDSASVVFDTNTGNARITFYASNGASISMEVNTAGNLLMEAVEYMAADSAHVQDYFLFDKLGANALQDTVTLTAAKDSVDVSNSMVTANSIIDVTVVGTLAGPVGHLYPKNRGAGTFTIASSGNETENQIILYRIVKP